MKIRLSILLSFCVSFTTAQISIKNISLTKPDTNFLYTDKGNVISILGIDRGDYELSTTNSRIDTTGGIITLYPKYDGKQDTIRVFSKKKVFAQKIYEIKKLPNIDFLIAGSRDSIIGKEILLLVPYLSAYLPNCLFKYPYDIHSFNLRVQRNRNVESNFKGRSNKFSQDILEEIKQLKSGDKLYFDNIICGCPDCALRNLGGRIIRII